MEAVTTAGWAVNAAWAGPAADWREDEGQQSPVCRRGVLRIVVAGMKEAEGNPSEPGIMPPEGAEESHLGASICGSGLL